MNQLTRRSALRLLGGAAATTAIAPTLAGCATGGNAGPARSEAAAWPAFQPAAGLKPDLPATLPDSGVNGFYGYPTELAQSVAKTPGDGSAVSSLIPTYSPPPAGPADNKLWSAINKALNVDLRLNLVPVSEYDQKLAAITATNDLPDTMLITGMPRAKQFVAAKCADLTDFLSGDKILEYPNLAAIPTYAWQSMGRVNGGIYGIPLVRTRQGSVLHVNRDLLDAVGAPDGWDQDQFLETMRTVSADGRFGLGTWAKGGYAVDVFAATFGAPNGWQLAGGTFTTGYQAPEYRQALEFVRDLVKDRFFHPSSNSASQNDIMNLYYSGTVAAVPGNFMNYATGIYFDRVGDRFHTDVALPIGGQHSWLGSGIFGYTVFKSADPERIRMLLRMCDYLAAPYGTVEYELVTEGVEGVHFTRTGAGLQKTKLADTENQNTVPVKYLADTLDIIQVPGHDDATKRGFELYEKIVGIGTADPSIGLESDTQDREGPALAQKLSDLAAGIMAGRNELTEWDAGVEAYLAGGGQKIADELAAAHAETGEPG